MKKPAKEVEFEVVGKETQPVDPWVSLFARLMDTAFEIPGTGIRFGLDPLIGLIPGLGDGASALISVGLILKSARHGLPRIVLARMALNVLLNAAIGAIPVVGDVFSLWFRSNALNYALLQKHAGKAGKSTRADWIFVLCLLGALVAALVFVLVVAATLFISLWKWALSH